MIKEPTKLYMYDAEDRTLIECYKSINECARDNNIKSSGLIKMTEKYPMGYVLNGAIYSRQYHGKCIPEWATQSEQYDKEPRRCQRLSDDEKKYILDHKNDFIIDMMAHLKRDRKTIVEEMKRNGTYWDRIRRYSYDEITEL